MESLEQTPGSAGRPHPLPLPCPTPPVSLALAPLRKQTFFLSDSAKTIPCRSVPGGWGVGFQAALASTGWRGGGAAPRGRGDAAEHATQTGPAGLPGPGSANTEPSGYSSIIDECVH